MEFQDLIDAPGMTWLLRGAPVFGGLLWLWLTTLLWRDGFTDLTERLNRPRWKGPDRAHAALMIPLRALMLTGAAALGAVTTTVGLLVQIGIVLNLIEAIRGGLGS